MLNDIEKRWMIGAAALGYKPWSESNLIKNWFMQCPMDEVTEGVNSYLNKDYDPEVMLAKLKYEESVDYKALDDACDAADRIRVGTGTAQDAATIRSLSNINIYNNMPKIDKVSDIMQQQLDVEYVDSGIYWLNRIVGHNGFQKGREYVFCSRAKGGKSVVLQNIAHWISCVNPTYKVIYISLENNVYDFQQREKSINQSQGPNSPYKAASYDFCYEPKLTISKIKAISKDYDIIIVDYLARIIPEKDYKNTYEMYGDYADELHYLAADNNKIVITAAQLSRAALSVYKNKEQTFVQNFLDIDQDCIADSMSIIRNADCVITTTVYFDNDNKTKYQLFNNIACRFMTDSDGSFIKYLHKYMDLPLTLSLGPSDKYGEELIHVN